MYNETYDDYIRSILGYPSMGAYEDSYQDYRNQNMYSNINNNSINSTSDMDLESSYPEIYKIVYPMITKKCDNVRMSVTNDDIQNMTDEIYFALENTKTELKVSEKTTEKKETRQINRDLRDLIQILLIRELLRRRRPQPRPPMPGPRPPMRPPVRPPFRPGGAIFNRDFEISNYDIFEN